MRIAGVMSDILVTDGWLRYIAPSFTYSSRNVGRTEGQDAYDYFTGN